MIEIIPGIYQLQLSMGDFPPGYTTDYLIKGNDGYLLIDTGWDTSEALASLKEQLAQIGISIKDISQIVLTHSHGDHAALASRLKHSSQALIYMHKLEVESVKSRFSRVGNFFKEKFIQQIDRLLRAHGMPDSELTDTEGMFPETTLPPFPDITLHGDETITAGNFNLQVIWTPGHAPGHVSLYEPAQKILFSADLIPPTTTSLLGLHLQLSSNPLADQLNSLNAIKQLEVNLVLPSHEHPFTNLHQRIEGAVQYHKQRNAGILKTITNGSLKTAYQISVATLQSPSTKKAGWHKLSRWNKRRLVLETIAHLEAMRFSGEIDKFSQDNIIYYQTN